MKRIFVAPLLLLIVCCGFKSTNTQSTKDGSQQNQQIQANAFVTAKGTTLRLSPMDKDSVIAFQPFDQPMEKQAYIFVDPKATFQTMVGIGGALTDASAETFAKLSKSGQEELLTAYYDTVQGIGYNIARTSIASCDFSSTTYSYIKDKDSTLSTFSVAHDEQYRIPLIQRALKAAGGKLPV
ncbi:MAG TPA: glycosyl hydrolase, partial [Bacteroidales bacterium]